MQSPLLPTNIGFVKSNSNSHMQIFPFLYESFSEFYHFTVWYLKKD